MSTASNAAENMWKSILQEAGYQDLAPTLDKHELLRSARKLQAPYMKKVEEHFLAQGRGLKWDVMSQTFVLDKAFGLDSLIAPTGQKGVNFAFDVTLNAVKVNKKMKKNIFLQKNIWPKAGLGIVKSAVVLLIPSPKWGNEWGWGLCSQTQREALVDEAIDILVAMEERTSTVTKWVITF